MPSILKRRYSLLCILWWWNTTHEAWVASPALCEMSKHSIVTPPRSTTPTPTTPPPPAPLLRALWRRRAGQLQFGVFLRHPQPARGLLGRLVHGGDVARAAQGVAAA